ncbi:phosphonoacetaldehyde hydrolase [Pseudoalteromonas sp. C2R02]|uniref:phosphonoacetaldehyde hydrolase n=1 Tax=Pseudoalteromonas sp. C2R02 TaxID=2841565 RepID=UPI001C0A351A|nr:phosphonoacetaldehyde hydrolase [Pseudoalteromonas sp. C2R02]MBU2972679.1 phosphonoacetaldehyde hydrolase [Pseudoalteromonas sp. C2R02]
MNNKVKALILDWAGTVVDHGSVAPTTIFVEAFKQAFNFDISLTEARVPMGMGKWDHIKTLGELPEIDKRWQLQFGQAMQANDVDHIYETFMPLQKQKVADHAAPIKGVLPVITQLQQQGIKIGSCSGYPKQVMDILKVAAAEYGYKPDACVASDELAAGSRPGPWMALENVNQLAINNVAHCVKVDDSAPGIAEGLNAGMWTVGVALSGNAVGLTEQEWQTCDAQSLKSLTAKAYQELSNAGAHFVIDSLVDISPILNEINARLARGERP